MSNIEAKMRSLNEHYNVLSASYLNLHEKFDIFKNEAAMHQGNGKLQPENPSNFHSKSDRSTDGLVSFIRVVSIDKNSKV